MKMCRNVATYEAEHATIIASSSVEHVEAFVSDAQADIGALANALTDLLALFDIIDGGEHDDDPTVVTARSLLA